MSFAKTWDFQSDNIIIQEEEGSDAFKFRDSYTIKVYNCTPVGVNEDEFYVKLSGHDETLANFLREIFHAMGIEGGSLEKTILSDNSLILQVPNKNTIKLEKEKKIIRRHPSGESEIISRNIYVPHIKPLTNHFHITQNHQLDVSLFVQNFRIVDNKYLIMSLDLKKIIYQASDENPEEIPHMFHPNFSHFRAGPILKLDDFLALRDPIVTLDASETKLYERYSGTITSSFKIED